MALKESNMMPLGTKASAFELVDVVSNITFSLEDIRGEEGTLVMFICAHCPYVKNIEEELSVMAKQYKNLGIGFVGISSNDAASYPEDAPDGLRDQAKKVGFEFPYLYDETQEVAKAYDVACTPDFFLFNDQLSLVYRGRFDSSTPGNTDPISGDDLRLAITHLLEYQKIPEEQHPSVGCSIKWKE
ncbi:MAG: thioredoxin family protein [Bacteroidota bacterium]